MPTRLSEERRGKSHCTASLEADPGTGPGAPDRRGGAV